MTFSTIAGLSLLYLCDICAISRPFPLEKRDSYGGESTVAGEIDLGSARIRAGAYREQSSEDGRAIQRSDVLYEV